MAAGGGFVFGYDIGIISTTLLSIQKDIPMTSLQEGWFVGMIGAGGFLGCAVAGPMCDMFGRWKTMFFQNVIFAIGALITASSHSLAQLLIGRFLVGIASVTSAIAGVPYMTEISPAVVRGQMICVYEIWVSVGVLVSFLTGYIFVDISHASNAGDMQGTGWRYAYSVPALVAIIQCMCLFSLPESPKWLLERGQLQEAYAAIEKKFGAHTFATQWELLKSQRVNATPSVSIELEIENLFKLMFPHLNGGMSPRHSHSASNSNRNSSSSNNPAKKVAALARFRQDMNHEGSMLYEYSCPLIAILILQAFTQLSGGVVVRNYAATIFASNGRSEVQALRAVTILGKCQCCCCCCWHKCCMHSIHVYMCGPCIW